MPPRARIYLHCVVGTGVFLLANGLSQFVAKDLPQFFAYFALALLAATWKFKVPGIPVCYSATFAFVLIGIVNFSLAEALAMGCSATLVQCLWRAEEKWSMRKLGFNVTGVAIGIAVAYPVHFELTQGPQEAPGMLLLAALLFFVVNTALVSGMVALMEDGDFRVVWRRLIGYSLPYYLVGGSIATFTITVNRAWGWQTGLLIVPMLYLAYYGYRTYLQTSRRLGTGG